MAIITEDNEVLHKVEVVLRPNTLGKGDGPFVARVKTEAPLSIEKVCISAKNRGGATGRVEDLIEHAHILVKEVVYQLLNGFSVQFGDFFSLHMTMGGTYHSEHENMSGKNLHVTIRILNRFLELIQKVQVENEGFAGDTAYIDDIIDVRSDALNGVLTPGGMAHIQGGKIKVEGEAPEIGVWFVNQAAGNVRAKVAGNLALNRPTEVMGEIPALTAGTYKLEIVTRYSNSTILLKEPRVIKALPILTVA
ncbi:hypothetical protein FACS1894147_00180 [Spirochaetia bacterium]|nr:hypothetical protein FACS1894147_00180 [Spirochaetia bacterium]